MQLARTLKGRAQLSRGTNNPSMPLVSQNTHTKSSSERKRTMKVYSSVSFLTLTTLMAVELGYEHHLATYISIGTRRMILACH
jgi:hypothetical protein